MNPQDQLIYENAQSLRTHQDNLRWTISGGYVALFGAAATFFHEKPSQDHPGLLAPNVALALFIIGNLFLAILAVESWYYNVHSGYVKDCEERFLVNKAIQPLAEYTKSVVAFVTPYHHSFFFVLLFVALTNELALGIYLMAASASDLCLLIAVSVYLPLLAVACRYWQAGPFKVLQLLKRLLAPRPPA